MDGRFEMVGRVESVEHIAGAFFKAFAAFHELAYRFEAGRALGERAVGFHGGGACRVEVAAGVLVGAFGALECLFEFGNLRGGGFDFALDA